ncbi:hypothetical protein PCS_02594 [Desulfocurvibacter africanus PCS]|uniref:Uncharacterized protein n=1 Tax=Desulfocurvibacter africanus PCS TaxID=1262666 RepID=M5PQH1_DESAF|nr:hypothetical protein PCS_02594 [Desulfocurvibacter africanus PCS]
MRKWGGLGVDLQLFQRMRIECYRFVDMLISDKLVSALRNLTCGNHKVGCYNMLSMLNMIFLQYMNSSMNILDR